MHAYARVCGPDKGCDGCLCARACACEYVRNDGEGALIWITPRFLAAPAPPQKNSFGGVGGVNVRVFWVGVGVGGVWGRKTHGSRMLTLPLQVVTYRGDNMRLRLRRRVLAPDPSQQNGASR